MEKKPPTEGWVKLAALVLLVAVPSAVLLSYALAWFQPPVITTVAGGPTTDPRNMNTPFIWPGLRLPSAVAANEADLPDTEPVIGVSAGGRQRAYCVRAMAPMTDHVINDMLNEVAVTVTYDDRTDKAQVFTTERTGRPLDVEMGGYYEGMLLRHDRRFFRQDTGRYMAPPGEPTEQALLTLPHTRTDWKTWRTTYPESDVFVGQATAAKK
jgi:hypothetical protein